MAYVKPQVLVFQEFTNAAASIAADLPAWIVGQNAEIHERGEAVVGDYADYRGSNVDTVLPNLSAGSKVEEDSVHIYVDDALIQYCEIPAADTAAEDAVYAYCMTEAPNQLVFNNFNVKENGNFARAAELGTRDVQIGDTIRISGYGAAVAGASECAEVSFDTRVVDFAVTVADSTIMDPARKTNKAGTSTASCSIASAELGTYTGSLAEEHYQVYVDKNSLTYWVASASDTDNYPSSAAAIQQRDGKYIFKIGTQGMTASIAEADLTGDFTVSVTSGTSTASNTPFRTDLYTGPYEGITLSGEYDPLPTGFLSQVYKITVTGKHNTTACSNLELRIISESGLDNQYKVQALSDGSGNFTFNVTGDGNVTATLTAEAFANVTVGTQWAYTLTGAYNPAKLVVDKEKSNYSGDEDTLYIISCISGGEITTESTAEKAPVLAYQTLSGSDYRSGITVAKAGQAIETALGLNFSFEAGQIALNETWIVRVLSGKNTEVRALVLSDSLPQEIQTTSEIIPIGVKFCVVRDVELTEGVEIDGTQLKIDTLTAKVHLEEFQSISGQLIDLQILSGTISAAYREWVADGVASINWIASINELEAIPGPLTPDNPLKYALYKALSNSNGSPVAYTNVQDDTQDGWAEAFGAASGSREVYALAPITQDINILKLAAAAVQQDSNEETCAWKICYLNTAVPDKIQVVGRDTSFDGNSVIALMNTKGLVQITSKYQAKANASLESVKPGDIVKFYTGFNFTEYVIDSVSGDTFKVQNPPAAGIVVPSIIEIEHTLTKNEQVEYIANIAQSFAHRRVNFIWPDAVSEGTYTLPGSMLCAAVAGLASGVLPHQGLTRVAVAGFDGLLHTAGYFTETQLNTLAEAGVWIVVRDDDGTIYTRHARTTDATSLTYAEEMITRNVDHISFAIRQLLEPYIGVTNVTDETIGNIRTRLLYYLMHISENSYSAVGPQLTWYQIIDISQDPLLLDRINVIVSGTVPKAVNNIEFHIQAG